MNNIFKIGILPLFISLFSFVCADNEKIIEQMVPWGELPQHVEEQINRHAPTARYYIYDRCVIVAANLNEESRKKLIADLKAINGIDNVIYVSSTQNNPIGQTFDDTAITAEISQKLLRMKDVYFPNTHVKTLEGGVACVFASLKKGADKTSIINELKSVKGVRHLVFCYSYRIK